MVTECDNLRLQHTHTHKKNGRRKVLTDGLVVASAFTKSFPYSLVPFSIPQSSE